MTTAPADTGDIPIDVDSDSNEAADESNITDNDVDAERARFEERHAEVLNNIADVEQQVWGHAYCAHLSFQFTVKLSFNKLTTL